MKKYLAVIMVCFMTLFLTSCGETVDEKTYFNAVINNAQSITNVSQKTSIFEGEMLLTEETLALEKDTAKSITKSVATSKHLAPINAQEFYETDTTTIYYTPTQRYILEGETWIMEQGVFSSSLTSFDWEGDYFEVVSFDKTLDDNSTLIATVKSENLSVFLGSEAEVSDVSIKICINQNKQLLNSEVKYKTDSGKNVIILNTYGYEVMDLTLPI